uniref:Prolyl 4-hydroxylase alpha-subunit N-terminal domain-containing protein n=1 Tax=Clastoptera arizonana TaxID=38151 RepID=A0A1B6CT54_9HEMI
MNFIIVGFVFLLILASVTSVMDPIYAICRVGVETENLAKALNEYLDENGCEGKMAMRKLLSYVKVEKKLLLLVRKKLVSLKKKNTLAYNSTLTALNEIEELVEEMDVAHLWVKQDKAPTVVKAIIEARRQMNRIGIVDWDEDVYVRLENELDDMPELKK